jgi:hypothetical protein
MKRALLWMMLAVVCVAASAEAGEAPVDERLQEAQAALDEAGRLMEEGQYIQAIPKRPLLAGASRSAPLSLHRVPWEIDLAALPWRAWSSCGSWALLLPGS